MITIVTGIPGAGKTLYTVSELAKEYKEREIYYYRIPNLTLDWNELEDPTKWTDCPDGAVIIIDEAHEAFPKRDYRNKEPDYIEAMAVHRHRDMDIVLITQHPKDLDVFIRRRAGRHIHVEKPLVSSVAANVMIWPEYEEMVKLPAVREKCDSFTWKYPTEAFGVYKSAVSHTAKKKLPKALIRYAAIVAVGMVAVVFMGTKFFLGKSDAIYTNTEPVLSNAIFKPDAKIEWFDARLDRIPGVPFTQPLFDEIRKPNVYPKLACVSSAHKCWCYTQQMSRAKVTEAVCRDIVENGYFDAAKEDT